MLDNDIKGTCEAEFSSNLDVAIVIRSPFMKEVARKDFSRVDMRCFECAVWRAGGKLVREAPFHFKLMNQITKWLKCPKQVRTNLERIPY